MQPQNTFPCESFGRTSSHVLPVTTRHGFRRKTGTSYFHPDSTLGTSSAHNQDSPEAVVRPRWRRMARQAVALRAALHDGPARARCTAPQPRERWTAAACSALSHSAEPEIERQMGPTPPKCSKIGAFESATPPLQYPKSSGSSCDLRIFQRRLNTVQ